MVMRFLKYSLEREKKIAVVLLDDGGMRQRNLLVTSIDEDGQGFCAMFSGKKKPDHIPVSRVLCVGYARGDRGELEE